jgi:hypothetical protein
MFRKTKDFFILEWRNIVLAIVFGGLIGLYFGLMLARTESNDVAYTEPESETTEIAVEEESEVLIVEPITTEELGEPELEVTDEEYQLLLRVCMSEAGGRNGEPLEGKVAVIVTILNRVDLGMGTIEQVVHDAYSTAYNGEPDETCVKAVELALTGQHEAYPKNMIAFRTGNYHSFGTPYEKIGNHYFSTVEVK